ncbi:cryptochrome/photolyase family protein [Stappia sp.]|uniref:cryptochrome/photolyase family protein n=1 Tax=Stappia sp. TaxID=1870903 RepID=UPI003A9A523B
MPSPDTSSPLLVWFRDDLRTDDNPALSAALSDGRPVIGFYLLDEVSEGVRPFGGASRWWLHHSLSALAERLTRINVPLVLRQGGALDEVPRLAREAGASGIVWNRRYEAAAIRLDAALKSTLRADGLSAESFNGALLVEPWEVATKAGAPYKVFTPFFKALVARGEPARPHACGERSGSSVPVSVPHSDELGAWNLLPCAPDWAGGLRETWTPGEDGAKARLSDFLDIRLSGYAEHRDAPGKATTSRLSPHLRFGEISPRRIWHAAAFHAETAGEPNTRTALAKFQAELGWREFSYHLLFHFPTLDRQNFQPRFDGFPWKRDAGAFAAWTRGRTGYPLVDAGLRELWHTGYMHNRVRMVAASFLVKHLLLDWREGEAWFWDTLVDADPASNPASWQWVAGSGADAAPYFRIFNPTGQGEKFDPEGHYTRKWVPELAALPNKFLFRPHEAPAEVLESAGVRLGETYPRPIVDHGKARQRALDAFETLKTAE